MVTVETKTDNFVVLAKFDSEIHAEPTEVIRLCVDHYNNNKDNLGDYEINLSVSSIPKVLCEECSSDRSYSYN